jgi:hypothetical protein
MTHYTIPMDLSTLPQQRVYEIRPLPADTTKLSVELLDYEQEHELLGIPNTPNNKSIALCQVEWSWSPMHSRVDQYVIHKGVEYWLLWCGTPDDNAGTDINHWFPTAMLAIERIDEIQAGISMLKAFWHREVDWLNLDKYHWINTEDILSVADLESIAASVWATDEDDC